MLRRTEKYGGFWQGVTGALEVGETYQQGAARELWEETRFAPENMRSVDFGYNFPMQDEWKSAYHPDVKEIHERVFLVEIIDGAEPELSFEHDAFEWATFDRALAMLKWINNRDALAVCHRLTSTP
jgi:8-oxo-dGTP pyrophosphatase MutT (NUDIX family)